jgi:4-amino-4-deoxy-L-arabinose transferase-like glycosyltransferase
MRRPSYRTIILIMLAWAVFATILVVREGRYPAAMTGDEIWFAESAYNLLQDGTPRRLIHDDAVGSVIADCLPPVITLLQAGSFLTLGLNQQAIGLPSTVMVVAIVLLVFALARQAGAGTGWAGVASIAALGSQVVLRASLYSRYEGLIVSFFLLYVLASLRATGKPAWHWHFLRGFAFCLAGLSYYPTAPFVAFAAIPFEIWLWRRGAVDSATTATAAIGFALPAVPFAIYVDRYWAVFQAQILGNGGNHYLTFELPRHLLSIGLWRGNVESLPDLLLLAGFVALGFVFQRRAGPVEKLIYVACLITLIPAAIFPFQPRLLALPMVLALVVLAVRAEWASSRVREGARALLILWNGLACAWFALILVTVWVQWDARSYETVEAQLNRLMIQPGRAGIDQRAWLALRDSQPDRPLAQIFPGWIAPQVTVFESEALRDPEGAEAFTYLVLSRPDQEGAIAALPGLATAFARHDYIEIGRVAPPFNPLPWAKNAPYDLVVYQRRG